MLGRKFIEKIMYPYLKIINMKSPLLLLLLCTVNFACAQKGTYINFDVAAKQPLKVKELILTDKGIIKLPDEIITMKKLERVNLSLNKGIDIVDVIKKLSQLPNLKELNISSCELTDLPKEIAGLKTLKKLKLGANKFKTMPSQLSELSNLKQLIFSQYPDDDFRSFSLEEKRNIIKMLPNCKVILEDYFGSVHGHYRLGQREVVVTMSNLESI